MRTILLLAASMFGLQISHAQSSPKQADEIMREAYKVADKENKKVFVIFHASWCVWCHRMDKIMNDESCKKFFDDNYVITHLVVDEPADKKNLENPGANEFREKYGGDKKQGLPFSLILDKNGTLLADSKVRPEGAGLDASGQNIGCPYRANEVDYFVTILKKTASLSTEDQAVIEKLFRQPFTGTL